MIAVEVVVLVGGMWLLFHFSPAVSISAPEQKQQIRHYSVESAGGPIEITDLFSGTEFNRIIMLPSGRTVVEGGYVNSWGEQRIRIIGDRIDP